MYPLLGGSASDQSGVTVGHNGPPVLVGGDGAHVLELAGRPPIGVISDPVELVDIETVLEPGALLVLYTDGLIERREEVLDVGLDRLSAAATSLVAHPGPICRRLRNQVAAPVVADDICILTIRRKSVRR